jgi:tetratricopeptide (TPR) repeat protein
MFLKTRFYITILVIQLLIITHPILLLAQPTEEFLKNSSVGKFMRGVQLGENGKYEEAKQQFDDALGIDPRYALALLGQDIVSDVLKDKISEDAAKSLFRGMYYQGGFAWLLSGSQGEFYPDKAENEAMNEFNSAIKVSNKSALAYVSRALLYYQQHQNDLALQNLKMAISLEERAIAYYFRSTVEAYEQNSEGAEKDLDKAIELEPKRFSAFKNAAELDSEGISESLFGK